MARLNFLKKKKNQDQDDSASTSSSIRSISRKSLPTVPSHQESNFQDQYPGSNSLTTSPIQSLNMPSATSTSHRSPSTPQMHRTPQVPVQPHRAQMGNVANSVVSHIISPWNRFKLFDSPFPRYRHAAASISSEKNEIFLMGGLKEGSVFGDTWKLTPIENHQGDIVGFQAKNLEIMNHINPPARVGHSAVLCGNAFVIYGGDTVDTDDQGFPDNNFYLFNTNNCKYTIPSHILNKPNGRYGHTIGVVSLTNNSSRLYLFGGQLENDVFNDLYFFELNSFKSPKATWELVEPLHDFKPPPLTNHSMSVYHNQIYIFGGIYNNEVVSNDLWVFHVEQNKWTKINTTGYIPKPVNEHSSCIVNDKLYIYGGNDFKGIIYSSLYVLDLQSLVWSKLLDSGEVNGPGPRCGHSMTFLPKYNQIIIMGGDKNDYVDNQDDFEMYEEYRENIVGTMIFQLNLNLVNRFLTTDPNEKAASNRNVVRSMSALEEEYRSPITTPEPVKSPEVLRSAPEVIRASPITTVKPEVVGHGPLEVIQEPPEIIDRDLQREPSFVEVTSNNDSIKDQDQDQEQDSAVKKIISELNSEIQQLRQSTKEQMEIATEKINSLEQENKSLHESKLSLAQYEKQLAEKDELINELKGEALSNGTVSDATKYKLSSLELNNKLVYITNENIQLKEKLDQFEPFMNNQVLELENFQKIIKNQEGKIEQMTSQLKSEEVLQTELNELKTKYDNLTLEFNNYKLIHGDDDDDEDDESFKDGDETIDTTTVATRSITSKRDISTQLEEIISIWNVKKEKEPTNTENDTVTQLQSQIDELMAISKSNDQSSEIESLRKQLNEKVQQFEKLEDNYKQAIQSVNNTSKALKLNQEEFEHQKILVDKLSKENSELKLFKKSRRMSSRSGTPDDSTDTKPEDEDEDDEDEGISNAHLNIKIKDLEADLYIIKQERDQLKEHVTSLQKELYLGRSEKS